MKSVGNVLKGFVACALGLSMLNTACAKGMGADVSVTVDKDVQSYVINADGSFVLTHDSALQLNDERAEITVTQRTVRYNPALEILEITEAYTQKPNGRKVMVAPDKIKDKPESAAPDVPMFKAPRMKAILYPEAEVGDLLVLQYKKKRTTPLFPGQFEDLVIPDPHPIKEFRLLYDAPAGMPLYADAVGFAPKPPVTAGGRTHYEWDHVPGETPASEPIAVSFVDHGQRLAISSFADFAAFGRAYEARAKALVTPKIAKLAGEITAKLKTPQEKALALDDWVRNKIREVPGYIGANGMAPHAADTVLENRYGDSKDQVELLMALLTATGIDSTPAFVNGDNTYTLPKVPVVGVLNHVFIFVPSLNLYLDPMVKSIAPGYLLAPRLDKPVLLTRTGQMTHTPLTQSGKITNDTQFKIAADGTASFTSSSVATGWQAEYIRFGMRNTTPADRNLLAERVFVVYGRKGSGKMDAGKVNGTEDTYQNKLVGRVENMVTLPGPTNVSTPSGFGGGIAQAVYWLAPDKVRTRPFSCFPGEFDEQLRMEFPQEMNVTALPEAKSFHLPALDYTSEYARLGSVVLVKRHYHFHHAGAVCSLEEFKAMRPVIDQMNADLRSSIVVEAARKK